jgi:hypothetical protein
MKESPFKLDNTALEIYQGLGAHNLKAIEDGIYSRERGFSSQLEQIAQSR